jgi:hypothetical protein
VLVSEDDLLERIMSNPDEFGRQGTLTIFFLVYTVDDTPGEDSDVTRVEWTFRYDFEPPGGPPLVEATAGERSVRVTWRQPSQNADDIEFYEVRYCPSLTDDTVRGLRVGAADPTLFPATSTAAYRLLMLPCGDPIVRGSIQETETSVALSEGIEERRWVAFTLLSEDRPPFFNTTETSTVYAVRTESALDFFERQGELGGGEDGGFCFVATAAHGSYAHPVVKALRVVRDEGLGRLPFGRALTRLYYQVSPPLAAALERHPVLAAWTRPVLLGFTALVGLAGLALSGLLLVVLVRRLRRLAVGAAVVAGALGGEGAAHAQLRPEASGPVGLAFELEAGPYLPQLGLPVEDGGSVAWSEVYGSDRARVLINLGGEIQVYRGDLGTVSVGGSAGFMAWGGRALFAGADGELRAGPEGSSTFNLVPLTLTVGYRFDLLMDRTPVPFAPYVRGGLAYALWWNTRDDGSLSRFEEGGEERTGIGGQPGLTGAVGISLSLNALDRGAAAKLHATSGVRATYLYFEGQTTWIDGFGGEGFDLSDDLTWFAGLMIEL